jgi:hypothetical protein
MHRVHAGITKVDLARCRIETGGASFPAMTTNSSSKTACLAASGISRYQTLRRNMPSDLASERNDQRTERGLFIIRTSPSDVASVRLTTGKISHFPAFFQELEIFRMFLASSRSVSKYRSALHNFL